jgi:F-type H+-transporting ATPase subunit gamma
LRTKLYAALLDSQTAEHAARTIAMQTASDNAQELLEELNLTYNKRRQQAITDELSDITSANL